MGQARKWSIILGLVAAAGCGGNDEPNDPNQGKKAWTAAVTLISRQTSDTGWLGRPSVSASADGGAVAIWSDDISAGVEGSRFTPGKGWSEPPTNLDQWPKYSDNIFSHCPETLVRSAPDGRAVALFSHRIIVTSPYGYEEFACVPTSSHFDPQTGWSAPAQPKTGLSADLGAFYPHVVLQASGQALALWGGEAFDLYYSSATPDGVWSDPTLLNRFIGDDCIQGIQTAGDGSDGMMALYIKGNCRNGKRSVWARRSTEAGGWGEQIRLSDFVGPTGFNQPSLAVNARGQAIAIWTEGRTPDVVARVYDPATGWGALQILSDPGRGGYPYAVSAALNDQGRGLVAWVDHGNGLETPRLLTRRLEPAGGWAAALVAPGTPNDAAYDSGNRPTLKMHSDGTAFLLLRNQAAFSDPQGVWGAPESIIGDSGVLTDAVLDRQGNVTVIWAAKNGIYAKRYE